MDPIYAFSIRLFFGADPYFHYCLIVLAYNLMHGNIQIKVERIIVKTHIVII